MRTFIAIKLPDEAVSNLIKMQNQLEPFARRGSFTPEENLHVTLKFLGDVSVDTVQRVMRSMDKLGGYLAPQMSFQQVSTLRAADVVVAKLKSQPQLFEMEKLLTYEMDRLGITAERRIYTPHVTLMRHYAFDLPFTEVAKSVKVFNKPFIADEICLFETQFNDRAPVSYNEMYCIKLPHNAV